MPSFPTLQQGSSGEEVRKLQITFKGLSERMKRPELDPGTPDGQFGPKTAQAIRNFQTLTGLTADGIVGPKTWAAIQDVGSRVVAGETVRFPGAGAGQAVSPQAKTAGIFPTGNFSVNIPGLGNVNLKTVAFVAAIGLGVLMLFGKGGGEYE